MYILNIKTHHLFRTALLILSMVFLSAVVHADNAGDFWLVTPDEYLNSSKGKAPMEEMFTKSFGAPVITLVSPKMGKEGVSSPMKIELLFKPSSDAQVLPESFKVLYGMFKLDVTDRILEHAEITSDGVVASKAKLPLGKHSIALEISDSLGRTGRTQLKLTVVE